MKLFRLVKKAIIILLILYILSLSYVLAYSMRAHVPESADAALVLGAKVNLNNTPSSPLLNRSEVAADLYSKGIVKYVLTTGGLGLGSEPEAKVGSDVVINKGVPEDKIFKEESSHNTYENVENIKGLAQQNNIKSVVVVSDRFHVARGVLVARGLGFKPVYWAFPPQGYYPKGLLIWNYAREAVAVIFYIPKLLVAQF